jgi:hypothetical protein
MSRLVWKWVKLPVEILNTAAYGRLNDRLYRRATEFRLLAGKQNADGCLPPPQDMAWMLRTDVEDLEQDCIMLEEVGILDRVGGAWRFASFEKDQEPKDRTAAERQRRHREHMQEQANRDATVTSRVMSRVEAEVETEIEAEGEQDIAAPAAAADALYQAALAEAKSRPDVRNPKALARYLLNHGWRPGGDGRDHNLDLGPPCADCGALSGHAVNCPSREAVA